MGYTHYYSYDPGNQAFTERWPQAVEDTAKIAAYISEQLGIGLGDASGEGVPEITPQRIALNGRGAALSHETLLICGPTAEARQEIVDQKQWFGDVDYIWMFCKTARKPYDLAVTSILLRFRELMPQAFAIASDGSWTSEWQHGARYWGPGCKQGASPVQVLKALFGQVETPSVSPFSDAAAGPPCTAGGKRPYPWPGAADR